MRLAAAWRWMLVAASAGLQVVIFPLAGPMPGWHSWLAWIAVAPFLVAILRPGRDGRMISPLQAALLGYSCGFFWYLGNCYWIYQTMYLYGGLAKPAALGILILFCFYLGLYHALFGWLLRLAAGKSQRVGLALIAAPFLWVAVELARAHVTSFPWDQLGMSQIDHLYLTSLAPWTGVYGISFLLLAASAWIVALAMLPSQRKILQAGILAVVIFVMWPRPRFVSSDPKQIAVMLQPNGDVADQSAWYGSGFESQFAMQSELTARTAAAGSQPDIVIWPETPAPLIERDSRLQEGAQTLARQTKAPFIMGDIAISDAPNSLARRTVYNSASFFTADGKPAGRYDKMHLVPFGEYVPFRQMFSFAGSLTEKVGSMTPGQHRVNFVTGGHSYGVFICYESIFADEVRQFAKNGADVLVNISDDGWYGDTSAPWQHLNMARMRAIENDRWILRDTNSGITAAIDPEGRVVSQLPRHELTALRASFSYLRETTFYTRHGDWFAYACTIMAVAMLGFAQFSRAQKPVAESH